MLRRSWIKKQKPKSAAGEKQKRRSLEDMDFWSLVRILDREFSLYIRGRAVLRQGQPFVRCITCGRIYHWKNIDFGHYHQREFFGVRWDERNGGLQCIACNRFKEGMKAEMHNALERAKVDLDALQALKDFWGRTHPTKEDLIQRIGEFRAKNAGIRKEMKGVE